MRRLVLWCIFLLPLLAFGLVPVLWLLGRALLMGSPHTVLSRFGEGRTWALLGRTLAFAGSAATWGTVLGGLAGYLLGSLDWRGKTIFRAMLVLPLAVPPYIHAIGWTNLFQSSGLPVALMARMMGLEERALAQSLYSFGGGVFLLGLSYAPIAMLFGEKALALVSPSSREAAWVDGADAKTRFAVCDWPLLRPALVSAWMILFLLANADLGIPTILKVRVFNFEVFTQLSAFNDWTGAALLTIPLLLAGFLILALESSQSASWELTEAEPPARASSSQNAIRIALCAVILGLMLGAPLGGMASGVKTWVNFREVLLLVRSPFRNSVFYAVTATLFLEIICVGLAWLTLHAKPVSRRSADAILVMGFATPGAILALGLLAIYDRPSLGAWISPVVLVIAAIVVRYALVGQRVALGALAQIPAPILEAARLDGASAFQQARFVIFPLARVAALAIFVIGIVMASGEIGSTILLYPPGGETLAIALYSIEANSPRSYVAALAAIQAGSILLFMLVAFSVIRRGS